MKHIFGILIIIIFTNLYSCKKNLSINEKIIGTWVGSPKQYGGYAGHTDTFIFMPDSNLNLVSSALDVLSQKGNMKYFFDKNNLLVKVIVSTIP